MVQGCKIKHSNILFVVVIQSKVKIWKLIVSREVGCFSGVGQQLIMIDIVCLKKVISILEILSMKILYRKKNKLNVAK